MNNPFATFKSWVRRQCLQPTLLAFARPFSAALARLVSGNDASPVFARHGFVLLRKHYYLPIPDEQDFASTDRLGRTQMIGVDLRAEASLQLLDSVFPQYLKEFRTRFPHHLPQDGRAGNVADFYLVNGAFMAVDAHAYYTFVRHFKPRRVIEIGSGFSTRVAAAACLKNQEEGRACRLTAIEPYPAPWLKAGFAGLSEVIECRVQDVPLATFTSLQAGDILFIDSTHVLREGGDVHIEYCEILPRLAHGVVVHIHDISLPKPYPRVYRSGHLYWNEQYLLQALLSFTDRYEVLWPGNALMEAHPERLRESFPEIDTMRLKYPQSEPSSFWMRVRDEAPGAEELAPGTGGR